MEHKRHEERVLILVEMEINYLTKGGTSTRDEAIKNALDCAGSCSILSSSEGVRPIKKELASEYIGGLWKEYQEWILVLAKGHKVVNASFKKWFDKVKSK